MKAGMKKLAEDAIRREYPIDRQLPGWFFRVREVSPSVYCVEGTDLWGRRVSETGTDEDELLRSCVARARDVIAQTPGVP